MTTTSEVTSASLTKGGKPGRASDSWGGLASMLVALPSAIAFGVSVVAPLGAGSVADGAVLGILGTVALGLIAPLFGGTPRLITAPCAPAAAVLAALMAELVTESAASGVDMAPVSLFILLMVTGFLAGLIQLCFGAIGGGRLIKYIPYPVVSGYLSGVGVLILLKQLPKLFALPHDVGLTAGLLSPSLWQPPALITGSVTMILMIYAPKVTRRVPAPIIGLLGGMAAFWLMSYHWPELSMLQNNSFVIGPIAGGREVLAKVAERWSALQSVPLGLVSRVLWPAVTLAVLLSIDTLKTCVILDAVTRSRHDSNQELRGQGLGNMTASLMGGMPGAGTMGATLVNLASGARTRLSGVLEGLFALAALLALGGLIAWVPVSALAGILIVVAFRMIDRKSIHLLKHPSTWFDFAVIATVILVAVTGSLIAASGAGLGLAILLFLREQIRSSVIRRKTYGDQMFSRRKYLPEDLDELQRRGAETVICELQGSLFFGTTDQLMSELERDLKKCRRVVLDMRRVQSVDFTATHMLEQVEAMLADKGGELIFSDVARALPSGQDLQAYLDEVGLARHRSSLQIFASLNEALEYCEDRVLEETDRSGKVAGTPLELEEFDLLRGLGAETFVGLRKAITEQEAEAGEKIFGAGETGDSLFLVRKGAVRIILPLADGRARHLASFTRRDFFGDLAFLDRETRSADAIAAKRTWLYVLSRERFDALAAEHPLLGQKVFSRLARALAHRLRQTDRQLREIEEA